jgi:hypothetical protein
MEGGPAAATLSGMKRRLALVLVAAVAAVAVPLGTAAAASPTVRLTIMHTVQGCHVWLTTKVLGPSAKITVKRGTRLVIRPSCPMDFDFAQAAGPRLALGNPRTLRGATRTIVFARTGVYRLRVKNVQTPEEVGLQTLGPTNVLTLVVVVR